MYGIIHDEIFNGTLRASYEATIVLMALVTIADEEDNVDMTPAAIAGRTGFPRAVVDVGLAYLSKPDPHSRSKKEEGRRIVLLNPDRPWGWHVVNRDHYKRMRDREERNEYRRKWMRNRRSPNDVPPREQSVTTCEQLVNACEPRQETGDRRQEIDKNPKDLAVENPTAGGVLVAGTAEPEPLLLPPPEPPAPRRGLKRKALAPTGTLPDGEITADQAFDEIFWPEYPRQYAKAAARTAWKRLKLKDDDEDAVKAIMAGLRRDKAGEWRDRMPDKIPHASTWLNQRRWEVG